MTLATGVSPADSASKANSSRVGSNEPVGWAVRPKSTPTRMARAASEGGDAGAVEEEELKVLRGGSGSRSGRFARAFGSVEVHRTAWHHGRDRVLVDHLGHGIAQQDHVLVEGLDMPLQFDAVDQVDGHRHMFLAQQIQEGILQELAFVAHDMLRVERVVGEDELPP
eukprot:Opistho-1_new@50419